MKEEALKLAEKLKHWSGNRDELWESADMIRKLVEEIDCLTLTARHHEFMARHLGIIAKEKEELLEELKNPIMQAISQAFDEPRELSDAEILEAIEEFKEWTNPPYKAYEDTYMDGWLDACNEIYSAVFEILKKASEK